MANAKDKLKKLTAKDKYKLSHFVKHLREFKGAHTELVSVYVPAGYDLNNVISQLSDEAGTATNIKSKQTRTNVIAALEKMIQHLKANIGRTPTKGLAAFAGNVAEQEGKQDYQVWSIEPPTPLNQRLYRCDKTFILEPLEEMMDDDNTYGLVVFDNRDAAIGYLKGKTIVIVRKTHSEVPGKMRAGGQSSVRFARNRELAAKEHYNKIAEYMKEEFLEKKKEIKGIIFGGPGVTINNFMNKDYLTGDLKKLIIGTKDLSYTGEFGMQELVDKSQDLLSSEDLVAEQTIMALFFNNLSKDTGLATYGREHILKALEIGAVDKVLLSEAVDDQEEELFEEKAALTGAEIIIISRETREGVQLYEMGKYAAILRYAIE